MVERVIKYISNIEIDLPTYLLDMFTPLVNREIEFKLGSSIEMLEDYGFGDPNRDAEFKVLEYELLHVLHKTVIESAVLGMVTYEELWHLIEHNMDNFVKEKHGNFNNYTTTNIYAGIKSIHLGYIVNYAEAINRYVIGQLRMIVLNDQTRIPLHLGKHYADRMELLVSSLKYNQVVLTYPDPFSVMAYDPNYVTCRIYLTLDLSSEV